MPKLLIIFVLIVTTGILYADDGPGAFLEKRKLKYMKRVESADKKLEDAKKDRDQEVLKATKDYLKDLDKVKVHWTKKGNLEKALVYQKQIEELQKLVDAGKPVSPKFDKKATAGNQLPKSDLTERTWEVRCWKGERWGKWPLTKMTLIEPSYGLNVKNTTGIHSFALLTLKEVFNGDFKVSLKLKGGNSIGVGLASGVDSGIGIGCDQFGNDKEVSYVISRKKGIVSITANGKTQVLSYYKMANGNTPVFFKIGMRRDETAAITSLKVERGD